jgi:uncharacterized protein
MRLAPGRSGNIEDRRGQSMMRRGAPMGIGIVLVLLVLSVLTGRNFLSLADPSIMVDETPTNGPVESSPAEEALKEFSYAALDDIQTAWGQLMPGRYRDATLVLYRGQTPTACGFGSAAAGPFYCPPDEKVFLDLSFFDELRQRFGAPGDFAQAYVIAHEVGHHVQKVLGIEQQVRQLQQSRPDAANQLSVRMELQADCLAGVWGHSAAQRGVLETGDVDEGLNAASAIGDDRLQRQSGGVVSPESFTHGSSAQRVEWFRRGLQEGDPEACDTFGR